MKLWSTTLAALFALTLISGCGQKEEAAPADEAPAVESSTDEAPAVEAAPEAPAAQEPGGYVPAPDELVPPATEEAPAEDIK